MLNATLFVLTTLGLTLWALILGLFFLFWLKERIEKTRKQQEALRLKQEQERQTKQKQEALRLKQEALRLKQEQERQTKQQQEALRLKQEQERQKIRRIAQAKKSGQDYCPACGVIEPRRCSEGNCCYGDSYTKISLTQGRCLECDRFVGGSYGQCDACFCDD